MSIARRGRPRDEGSAERILAATLDLVAEAGIAGLTMDAVACRAGVGKATIYRRWSSKEALLLDAWSSCVTSRPVPDTGTLRGDLDDLFRTDEQPMAYEQVQRVFPQMIAAAKVNPDVAEAYRAFITERRRPLRTVIERWMAKGELPDDLDVELLLDLLIAPVLYRWQVTDAPVDDDLIARLFDMVLEGVRPRTRARR